MSEPRKLITLEDIDVVLNRVLADMKRGTIVTSDDEHTRTSKGKGYRASRFYRLLLAELNNVGGLDSNTVAGRYWQIESMSPVTGKQLQELYTPRVTGWLVDPHYNRLVKFNCYGTMTECLRSGIYITPRLHPHCYGPHIKRIRAFARSLAGNGEEYCRFCSKLSAMGE